MEIVNNLMSLLPYFESGFAVLALIALVYFFSVAFGFPRTKRSKNDGSVGSGDLSGSDFGGCDGGGGD